jgi:TonB-linked SusC/RagA family outer membrane protein
MLFCSVGAMAQQTITGTVTDVQTGAPLAGVNILVVGTSTGAATDADGHYSVTVPSLQDTLRFSFIGYKTKNVPIGGQTTINIELASAIISGQQLVVIGFGKRQKKDLTGSVTSIHLKNLPPSSSNNNIMESLRGRVSGLNVTGGNSTAGGEASFLIRGQKTLSASTAPLIVMNGIIFHGSLSDINMSDVKDINVLKGASAAAIYGSKAANGVIIITTKSGHQGEQTVHVSVSGGVQHYTHNVPYMNGKQYALRLVNYDYIAKLYKWYGTNPTDPKDNGGRPSYPDISKKSVITKDLLPDEKKHFLAGKTVDWTKVITRRAPMKDYNLSLSGGTNKLIYYLSGSHKNQDGVLKNDAFKRNTFNTRVSDQPTNWLTLKLNMLYTNSDYSGLPASLVDAKHVTPFASVRNKQGNFPTQYRHDILLMPHPLGPTVADNKDIRRFIEIHPHAEINIPSVKGLEYEFNYSFSNNTRLNNTSIPNTVDLDGASTIGGVVNMSNTRSRNMLINNIIHYNRNFLKNHKVNLTLLYSYRHSKGEGASSHAERFQNQELGFYGPQFGQINTVAASGYLQTNISYMARLNYSYKNKYLITGTVRRDGFSGFGVNNKYALFPSVSIGWVASREDFMNNISWVSLLKLRLAYGQNGNQGVGRYASLPKLGTNQYIVGGTRKIGFTASSLGNRNLKWEKTGSFNIGIDFGFLNNRISGTFELYSSQTNGVLVRRSLPGSTGYNSVWTNIGGVHNKGINLNLTTTNFKNSSLQWKTTFIYSINRNKITKLYGNGKNDIGNSWFIGKPIHSIYDYKNTGKVWSEEDLFDGKIMSGFLPGEFKLEDLNHDGKITAGDDRTIIGYQEPNYTFSISSSLVYKDFTFSFLITSIQVIT